MSNLPRPKVLPIVKYDPPQPHTLWDDISNVGNEVSPYLNDAASGIFGGLNQAGAYVFGGQPQKVAHPIPRIVVSDPRDVEINPLRANYEPTRAGASTDPNALGFSGASDGTADRRYDSIEDERARTAALAAEAATRMDAAVNNNRANTAAAQAAGDNVNLARLNAEWQRLTQSPLFQQMYGGSNEQAMKQRLVNVYMKPDNPAAANDLAGALSNAVADDVWAREATNAFGRPPNQLEWDEHWKAMNVGGRDPLAGHPQSIQNIQNTMNQFQQQNQNTSYNDYSNWAGGH